MARYQYLRINDIKAALHCSYTLARQFMLAMEQQGIAVRIGTYLTVREDLFYSWIDSHKKNYA